MFITNLILILSLFFFFFDGIWTLFEGCRLHSIIPGEEGGGGGGGGVVGGGGGGGGGVGIKCCLVRV